VTNGASGQAGLLVRAAIDLEKEVEGCLPEERSAVDGTLEGGIGYVLYVVSRLMEDVQHTKRRAQVSERPR